MQQDIAQILFSPEEIRAAVGRLGEQVVRDLGEAEELLVLVVLKGACVFAADLVRELPMALELEFVRAASYGAGTEPGALALAELPGAEELRGRQVLVVDDILNSGQTLAVLCEGLRARGAALVRTCVFLDKPARRAAAVRADYRCFEVGDHFVVGYGLDHAGRYRNLPFVGVLRDEVLAAAPSA